MSPRLATVVLVALRLGLRSPPLADSPSYVNVPPPKVHAGEVVLHAEEVPSRRAPNGDGPTGPLAASGGDLIGITTLGLGLLGAGVVVARRSTRRHFAPA